MMDTDKISEAVHTTVLTVARGRHPTLERVKGADRLSAELGLRSLDLARVVALLEMELGADPFAEAVAITSIQTVQDLIDAYATVLAGSVPASAQRAAVDLERAATRGAARATSRHPLPRKDGKP